MGKAENDDMTSLRPRARNLRTLAAAIFAGTVSMAVMAPSSGAIISGTSAQNVHVSASFDTVNGAGAWSVAEPLVSWQNELATAQGAVDLNYTPHGSQLGREDLIRSLTVPETDSGHVDFVISGVGFTPGELGSVPGGSSEFISAPVQVSALATLVEPPHGGFQTQTILCDPQDPTTWPPEVTDGSQCVVVAPINTPVRIPSENLAAMLLHLPGSDSTGSPRIAWNNPVIKALFGVQDPATILTPSQSAGPTVAGRSDADEVNYYMQLFIANAAPDVWAAKQAGAAPGVHWEPITERLAQASAGVTRDGAEQQVIQLAQNGFGVDGGSTGDVSGGVAAAPPSLVRAVHSAFPNQTIDVAEMQNRNGDWVGPTTEAIDKAVDAGGASPLYALTNKVAGAYPLVWVDNLYAPAHGLSAKRTESMATLIRYLVTTGQEKEAAVGEGRLSPALVAQALAAADRLVLSNCVGKGRLVIVSPDPGPLAPPTATAMHSIGNMAHCVVLPSTGPTTTTTTAAPATTSTTVPFTPGTSGSQPSGLVDNSTPTTSGTPTSRPTTVVTVPDSGSGGVIAAKQLKSGLLVAQKLPLPVPGGGSTSDRVATFLLGALLYLLVRKPMARLARRVVT
jgi:hypothetical protein